MFNHLFQIWQLIHWSIAHQIINLYLALVQGQFKEAVLHILGTKYSDASELMFLFWLFSYLWAVVLYFARIWWNTREPSLDWGFQREFITNFVFHTSVSGSFLQASPMQWYPVNVWERVDLISRVFQFPWHDDFHHCWFQPTHKASPNADLGRAECNELSWARTSWLQHATGPKMHETPSGQCSIDRNW